MLMKEKIKGFIFSPSKTFKAVKEERRDEAVRYYFSLLAIYSIIVSTIYFVLEYTNEPFLSFSILIGSASFGFVSLLIGAAWFHLWVRILGGKGYKDTLKIIAYARTPSLLFSWLATPPLLPLLSVDLRGIGKYWLSIPFMLWYLALVFIGIKEIHNFSNTKAFATVLIATLPLLIASMLLMIMWLLKFFYPVVI